MTTAVGYGERGGASMNDEQLQAIKARRARLTVGTWPADIDALLAEVERLTAENARLYATLNIVPREAIATEHNHFYPATKVQEWHYEAVHAWLYPETVKEPQP